jgi:hypothetical protein
VPTVGLTLGPAVKEEEEEEEEQHTNTSGARTGTAKPVYVVQILFRSKTTNLGGGGKYHVQGDQTFSLHLMITVQKVTSDAQIVPPLVSRHLLTLHTHQCHLLFLIITTLSWLVIETV